MISKHVWIPAALAIAAIVGCDSKPAEKIPTTAPTAIKEPHEVLKHLQYIAVRKDLKDISLVSPVDPQVADGAAWWFTSHSGDMGISLTADEIASLGVGNVKDMGYIAPGVARKDLQAKLDELSAKGQTAPAPKGKKDKKAAEVPGLPAEIDVATTAAYTRRVLAGDAPVPPALRQQVEHILHLSRQITAQASS